MKSLLENTQQIRVSNAVAAGTSDINSSGVNMDNADGVRFDVHLGTITGGAVTSLKLQQSNDNGSTDDWSDIAGSAVAIADTQSNKIASVDCYMPRKKWVRAVVDRGTANCVVDSIVATKYNLRNFPVGQDASIVATSKVLAGPAEGTA